MHEIFTGLRKFFPAEAPESATLHPSWNYETSILVCHSEEPFGHAQDKLRDEESAFDFSCPGRKNWEA
jgi:hypothetical protein